ncbi:predicted sulfite reductase subunit [Candidatus Ishikawaella capsulata Mpkobe]|uniref:Sulfurtransferase n=2 Tax=Candidatus Ishikawella capsulata TaxID=168169 RepID=C5WDL9_9ENTR|nr:predicted sulfite reductase subunit [Candidatus Ishikawaella capsulata Mpkobe]
MKFDKKIEFDAEGYLKDINYWSEKLAIDIAQKEGIVLNNIHWDIVHFLHQFYKDFNISPGMRLLVKAVENKYGKEIGNSQYLYFLFPKGPAKQATKIAGLPKPVNCI